MRSNTRKWTDLCNISQCTLSPVMGMLSGRLLIFNSLSPTEGFDNPLLRLWLSSISPMEDDTLPIILGSIALFMTLEWPFRTPSVRKLLPSWHLPDTSELENKKEQTSPKQVHFLYEEITGPHSLTATFCATTSPTNPLLFN